MLLIIVVVKTEGTTERKTWKYFIIETSFNIYVILATVRIQIIDNS